MDGIAWAREMALYNKWQNEILYGLCAELDEEEIDRDRGMFFGSILATLDHILMVDRLLRKFADEGAPPKTFDARTRVADGFADLNAKRAAFDDALLRDVESWSDAWLDEYLEFYSERHGGQRRIRRALFVAQMFNHATHHRSQVTVELHKMGIDYGNTDMPFNPHSQYR